MTSDKLKSACLSLLLGLTATTASAIPARPGLMHFKQSDGSTIDVRIVGDEYCHIYLTADGYPLEPRGRDFYHARISENGDLISTGIKAKSAGMRSDAEAAAISDIDPQTVLSRFSKKAAKANGRRQAPRMSAPSGDRNRFLFTNFPCKGKQKALVILVEYTDVKFTLDDPLDYFSRMMNEPGFSSEGGTGSAHDYFYESSTGQFDPEFDVFGPITLPNDRAYYGSYNDRMAWEMAVHACDILDSEIDFSQYDRDNDGIIDNIYIFYAGEGESSGGGEETVWPHAAEITKIDYDNIHVYDGKTLDHYATSNEWELGKPDGVGTFIHEFSHVMGLPDLYTTSYNQMAFTPGSWSALDYGPYNNDGRTPPLYSAFERYCVGWLDPTEITGRGNITLAPIGSNTARFIATGDPDEFFILENRQQVSWDRTVPGHGMLVWHIHYDELAFNYNAVNNDPTHQRIDIIEADDLKDIDSRAGDSFPGTAGITSLTDDTTPSMRTWGDNRLSLPLTNITETPDGYIHFLVREGFDSPAAPAAPAAPEVNDIGSTSFSLKWEAVEDATDYAVTVMKAGTYLPLKTYDWRRTSGATTAIVVGLEPSTAYECHVCAIGPEAASAPSPFACVQTTATSFADVVPSAQEATDVTDTSFRAVWERTETADSYLLTVYTKTPGETVTQTVDFTGGINAIPEGWSSSSKATYSMSSYAGKAIPALRMGAYGDCLESATISTAIRNLSFWHRGNGAASESNTIRACALIGADWKEFASIPVVSAAGGKTTLLTSIPEGTKAVRLIYDMVKSAPLAIDDVTIGYAGEDIHHNLPHYDRADTGDTGAMTVDGLQPGTIYHYTVTAISNGTESMPSNEITVTTAGSSAIDEIDATDIFSVTADGGAITVKALPGTTVSVTDITGRTVATTTIDATGRTRLSVPGKGIYIVTDGNNAVKTAI